MGFGNFFFRGRGNQKLINLPDTTEDIVSKKTIESNSYEMYKLINQLRDLSQTREYKYAEYDVMSADVIIRTALNMYADDATQVDENSKTVLSIDSKDEVLQKDLYSFLRKIKMEEKLRDVAYALGKYGNKYWKLYLTKDRKDIDHIEEIDDPGTVLDLWYQGEPAYFAENSDDTHLYKNTDEFDLYNHDSFIHFYVHSGDESDVIELMDNQELDSKGDPKILKYKVVEGESLIEAVRAIWRILRSLEDSLLAARLAKADYVRIFNIEVGDSSSTDTRLIVNKVKKVFDSAVSMDVRNGTYTATKQQRAIGDPIFNSVSNGQGSISIESVGGDIEVKSLVDIDYFNNQLFAGLRIPKTLMGFEESISGGFSNESTLVQLDIRYGKYIKKVIDSLVQGITDLCDIWLKLHGRENQIGKYKVVYNAPSTTEELARIKELAERVEVVAQLTDTLVGTSAGVNKVKLLWQLLTEFIPYQVFLDKIKPIMDEAVEIANKDIEIAKKMKENQLKQLEEQPDQSTPSPSFGDLGMSDPDAYVDSMNLGNDSIPFNPLGSDPMTGNPEVPNAGNSSSDDAAINQILKSIE